MTEPGQSGEIVIRGENVIPGYLAAQDNDQCFVDGWFRTGDAGSLAPDGSLLVEGRIKDLIVRGGEKIIPQEVEQVLAAYPGIAQAVVFGIADAELSEQVAAAVIPADGTPGLDVRDLRRFAAERMAPYKMPAHYFVCAEFPLTATGKIARSELAERFSGTRPGRREDTVPERAADAARAAAEPRDPAPRERAGDARDSALTATLSTLWATALHVDSVMPDADFFELGGDSLSAVTLLRMVSDELGAEFSLLALYDEVHTVGNMAAAIRARSAGAQYVHEGRP